jgi:hypothetical protein
MITDDGGYLSQPALRLLRFVPAEDRIHALTDDVVQSVLVDDTPHVHDLDQHQFTLESPMQPTLKSRQHPTTKLAPRLLP